MIWKDNPRKILSSATCFWIMSFHCSNRKPNWLGNTVRAKESWSLLWGSVLHSVKSYTHIIPHQHDFLNMIWTRKITINKPKWTGEIPSGHNPTQRTRGYKGMLGVREIVLSVEEHIDWLSNTKWSALKKMHRSIILQVVFRDMCIHLYILTCMHACMHACKKKPWFWKKVKRFVWEALEGIKQMKKLYNYIMILKIRQKF